MDPELAAALPYLPVLDLSDLDQARAMFDAVLASTPPPNLEGVLVEERQVHGPPGQPDVHVRIFSPDDGRTDRPAVLDIHGGGFALASAALDDGINARIVRRVGAVVVAVEYRRAPEHPFPAPAEDCYAALTWLAASASELGVDPARLALLGDSAGAGLAATTALWDRDRGGPGLAMQVLIEPMLDDRLQTRSMTEGTDTAVWNYGNAVRSWELYLGGAPATSYAAPARMQDLTGLPPTYLTVNELDPLRDEGVEYARRLMDAGVPTELHCWPGAFHGFLMVPKAKLTRRALDELAEVLRVGLGVDEPSAPPVTRS